MGEKPRLIVSTLRFNKAQHEAIMLQEEMKMLQISEILKAAKAASVAKSLEIWERDQKRDCGSCGGAILYLDARSKLAKVALAEGYASNCSGDIAVNRFIGDDVRSQNADIYQDSMQAFKRVLEKNGHAKAIKKFWTYID